MLSFYGRHLRRYASLAVHKSPSTFSASSTPSVVKLSDPLSKLSTVSNCKTYLEYVRDKQINIHSSACQGTLYELLAGSQLSHLLNLYDLSWTGGAHDQGIDLLGSWDLSKFWNHVVAKGDITPKTKIPQTKINGSPVRPMLRASIEYQRLVNPTKITKTATSIETLTALVQCKNIKRDISPAIIREMAGIYHFHVKNSKDMKRTFMFLVGANNLTKQGRVQFDSSNCPLVFCKVLPLRLIEGKDAYDIDNWTGGNMESFYCNQFARAMLSGLQLEQQVQQTIRDQ
ncbi:hypothetical protein CAAN1_10S04104 [[Candida] anglica]|uniref:Required for respiratory growth protein 7, mitochondrial n=1 Tax=[Candida] anglica TaxID=148631 RepID=A0ABP0EEP0_9ASCO